MDLERKHNLHEVQATKLDKLRNLMETVSAFISSLFVSLTRFLMKFSRDYRYVSRSLSAEKNKLKEMEGFGIGLREGSQMIWEPLPGSLPKNRKLSDISVPEIRLIAPSMERGLDASPPSHRASPASQQVGQLAGRESSQDSYRRDDDDTSEHESAFSLQTISSKDVTTLEEHDDTEFKKGKSSFVFLLYALWYTVLAHTDIVCYMMVFINQHPPTHQNILGDTDRVHRSDSAYKEYVPIRDTAVESEGDRGEYALHRAQDHRHREEELREDEEYPLSPEDTQQIIAGKFSEVGLKCVKLHDLTGPVHDDQEPIIAVTTTLDENASKHYPKVMLLSIKQYLGPVYVFFKSMLTPGARVTADVYAYMFLCDFLNFLVYLEENKVPVPFLVMMILQFGLIIIDRALYLRKYMLGKILFQHALIVGVHCLLYLSCEPSWTGSGRTHAYPLPRGEKKSNMSKYMLGGAVLVFVIAIIWFPLVFFAFGNSVIKFKYVITHPSNAMQNPPVLDDSRISLIPAHIWKGGVMIPNPERETLLALLDGTAPPDT
ncbi:putative piezo-type mechanosensitive ion channel component 2 [Operophtera brumata]|uniref:Putative piezo-type mechanosensitive ion channel component 2 n=1 Tax=Operophtera brumata TaxID=104452 RepID=A0A0L7KV92_OPEBR|nr:putative piezo-type mechanosensitive ion channel component 2 [Operophtera brumata]